MDHGKHDMNNEMAICWKIITHIAKEINDISENYEDFIYSGHYSLKHHLQSRMLRSSE
jgi:hypothetical protein